MARDTHKAELEAIRIANEKWLKREKSPGESKKKGGFKYDMKRFYAPYKVRKKIEEEEDLCP